MKGTQTGTEGVKLSLYASDIILHIENPKDSLPFHACGQAWYGPTCAPLDNPRIFKGKA